MPVSPFVFASGKIAGTSQQVDISMLAAGIYLLNVYSSEQKVQALKFVKE